MHKPGATTLQYDGTNWTYALCVAAHNRVRPEFFE